MHNPVTTREPSSVLDLGSQIRRFTLDSTFLNPSSDTCSSVLSNFLYFNNTTTVARGAKRGVSVSLRAGGLPFRRILHDFNSAVRFHCERIPIGFASLRVGEGDGNGGGDGVGAGAGDGNGIGEGGRGVVEDERGQLSGADGDRPKKVLILMSDTGGGHRASAEAIKAAFYEEFGDGYQVLVIFPFLSN